MRVFSMICCVIMLSVFISACANGGNGTESNVRPNPNAGLIDQIKAEEKDKVIQIGTDGGILESVDCDDSVTINSKLELAVNVDNVQGNPYDPAQVDVYAEFVNENNELKTVPAFWTQSHSISISEWDKTQEFDYGGGESWTATGGAAVKGVLDHTDSGVGVARVTLPNASSTASRSVHFNSSDLYVTGEYAYSLRDRIFFYIKNSGSAAMTGLQVKLYSSSNSEVSETFAVPAIAQGSGWMRVSLKADLFAAGRFTSGTPVLPDRFSLSGAAGTVMLRNIGIEKWSGEDASTAGDVMTLYTLALSQFAGFIPGDNYSGSEVATPVGDPYFCVRFNPQKAGIYTYRVIYKENGAIVAKYTSTFTAADSESMGGVLKVEPTLKRNFIFEDGSPYVPMGMNVGWYGELGQQKKTYEFYNYFEKMSSVDMNWARVWLSHWQFSMHNIQDGILEFDSRLIEASRFDAVLAKAEEEDIYITLCLLIHGAFVAGNDGWQAWHGNPFNSANGGYIDVNNPISFLTDEQAKEDFKKITRYTIARWGYSQNIMAWELWNEIGHLRNYSLHAEDSKAWHTEMANYIRGIDQLPHMITSSSNAQDDPIYNVNELDYNNPHWYSGSYGGSMISTQKARYESYGKPVLFSEIGPSGDNNIKNFQSDPTGIYLNQASWAGAFGYGAGGAMTWWWEAVHQRDLYYRFKPVSEYFKLTDNDYATMPSVYESDYSFTGTGGTVARAAGYKSGSKAYVYIYNNNFTTSTTGANTMSGLTFNLKLDNGNYKVTFFDTFLGTVISDSNFTASSGTLAVTLPSWQRQIALIIKKI